MCQQQKKTIPLEDSFKRTKNWNIVWIAHMALSIVRFGQTDVALTVYVDEQCQNNLK